MIPAQKRNARLIVFYDRFRRAQSVIAFAAQRLTTASSAGSDPSLRSGFQKELTAYRPAAIFFTMASTSLRSLSFRLEE